MGLWVWAGVGGATAIVGWGALGGMALSGDDHDKAVIADVVGGIGAGIAAAGLPDAAVQVVQTADRAAVGQLITMPEYVDVIVPRGGKGLVGLVQREARVPVFAHLEGICHIYVDAAKSDRF